MGVLLENGMIYALTLKSGGRVDKVWNSTTKEFVELPPPMLPDMTLLPLSTDDVENWIELDVSCFDDSWLEAYNATNSS